MDIREDAITRIQAKAPELPEHEIILWVCMVDQDASNARDPWSDDEIDIAVTNLKGGQAFDGP